MVKGLWAMNVRFGPAMPESRQWSFQPVPTVFAKDTIPLTNPVTFADTLNRLAESKRTTIGFNEETPIQHQKRFGTPSLTLQTAAARKPDRTHIAP
jgi:hypothetical protein